MKDEFDQYRTDWDVQAASLPHLQEVQTEVLRLRKQRKNKVVLWYSALIVFCMLVIAYVIYTDELNSLSESISEFLLLFASVFAFRNAWKNIHRQKREYLLSNVEFIRQAAQEEQRTIRNKLVSNLLFASTLSISVFFHFLEKLLFNAIWFLTGCAVLSAINLVIWLVIKPLCEKRHSAKNNELLSLIQKIK